MATMLIITGPQGSGNHLFSKLFSLHSAVVGWSELLTKHWVPHGDEPFAEFWHDPSRLPTVNWGSEDYYVTSISCPYVYGVTPTIPPYSQFIDTLQSLGVTVKLCIIGRDQNILRSQQQRVRDRVSLTDFEKQLPALMKYNPYFISQELAYLYKHHYMRSLSAMLDFPVCSDETLVNEILTHDANSKYFHDISITDLDRHVRDISGLPPK